MTLIFVFNLGVRSSSPMVLSGFTDSLTMSILLNILNTIEQGLGDELHSRRGPKPSQVRQEKHHGQEAQDAQA